ncbi:hypothetical protein GCM10023194_11450 [Planotetraspora phitsanulokensis]|uniref:Glycosyltransferase n=1 Tax=Planotetraspora phitsanulokensis TaxID=575192 RepID=A0A8J3UC03_9ACTN|nr:glycosyltransferase [Planotetraspora phitsanulokensis]GII40531.1 hypothetical protein Pph01_55340 [Planotetraspora phitsanulokensis]
MIRSTPRSPRTWGTSVGFGHCPESFGRVDGFSGPWHDLDAEGAPREPFDCVVVAVRTLRDLRVLVPMRGLLPSAGRIRVVLAETSLWAPPPTPVPGQSDAWARLADLRVTRTATGWHLDASFTEPVAAGEVVASVARGLLGTGRQPGQPVIGLAGEYAGEWRPGDADAAPADRALRTPERRDAPGCDLLLRLDGERADVRAGGPHLNLGRDRVDPGALPPVDEAVVNPIGFRRHPTGSVATLGSGPAVICGSDVLVRLGPRGELTDVEVARLRDVRGVVIPPAGEGGPATARAAARIVAGLAAAGVPVIARPDAERDAALGPELAQAVAAVCEEDLATDQRREEIAIRLRRIALRVHGAVPRWRAVASSAGLPVPPEPLVSVLLCTRRPEMIPFAIEQMEGQRGVRLELVVGLHGLPVAAVPATDLPVTVVEAPGGLPFGSVLNRMAAVASGTFLAKVDDDDWYGPDHLADLLLAQRYSGADLVGSAPEFVYLEPLDVTIRRRVGTERFAPFVAGGTMVITRAMFDAVGGFRPIPRTVDGQLLDAVRAAGGRIYRSHGFNYLLRRRNAREHTWQPPVQSFLTSYEEQWRGLVFNALMERTPAYGRRG